MNRHPKIPLAAVIVTAILVHSALTASPRAVMAGGSPQQDVKQTYLDKCSVCHGEDGAAKTAKGKKLKMKDIRSADVQKMTPAEWTNIVLKGKGDDMDAFEKELGADTCKKLSDYMRELSKK